jgi:hypothetical protein
MLLQGLSEEEKLMLEVPVLTFSGKSGVLSLSSGSRRHGARLQRAQVPLQPALISLGILGGAGALRDRSWNVRFHRCLPRLVLRVVLLVWPVPCTRKCTLGGLVLVHIYTKSKCDVAYRCCRLAEWMIATGR